MQQPHSALKMEKNNVMKNVGMSGLHDCLKLLNLFLKFYPHSPGSFEAAALDKISKNL